MKKMFLKCVTIVFASLLSLSVVAPPLVYANEVVKIQEENVQLEETLKEVDEIFSRPIQMSKEEIEERVALGKLNYPSLSEERLREILYMTLSPYSSRDSVWDGQGVTLDEFAWAFDNLVAAAISGGIGGIGQLVAQKGMAAAKAALKRAAYNAARRIGIMTGFIGGLLEQVFDYINIFYNVGYSIAQWIDARDFHPNNGRINAWA